MIVLVGFSMKEKLLDDLKNQDLQEIEKQNIVAVVEYIDSNYF